MKIKTLIVDDEPLALEVLETYIQQSHELELVGKCSSAIEARDFLQSNDVDLMFLDIQMPGMTGIELLKSLRKAPLAVFTTAYPNYALEGFELDAIDYLLKPIPFDRFLRSVEKAKERLGLSTKENIGSSTEEPEFFFVKADKKLVKVKYDEIVYIEGLKDYVIIKTMTGRVISLQTMKSLEDKLPAKDFIRIHRSFIVALDKILSVDGNDVEVPEKGATKLLPIGKNYKDELLELINRQRI
jgi:DNA-binding LytR/AlgR family response regulator